MKVNILGVEVDNLTLKESLKEIEDFLKDKKRHYVVTPNPEIIVAAQKNKELKEILNKADLAIADGVGLLLAAKILGKRLKERVTGTDLADKLCELAAEKGLTTGFLGGEYGVAEKAAECQKRKYSELRVVFAAPGDPRPSADVEIRKQISSQFTVHSSQKKNAVNSEQRTIDFLFVAYGAPKQEYWIARNLEKIPVKIALGVGGALDYFAGKQIRAPKIIQNLGLEWFWRLLLEPTRIKRQMALTQFVWLVIKEAIGAQFTVHSSQ